MDEYKELSMFLKQMQDLISYYNFLHWLMTVIPDEERERYLKLWHEKKEKEKKDG